MRLIDLRTGTRNGLKRRELKARALFLSAALSAAALSGGCYQDHVVRQITPMPPEPRADEATQVRGFSQSVSFYHSGTVQAWPTRWYLESNPDRQTRLNYVLDPLKMVAQTVSLPVTLVMEPPFEKVYYEGDVVPPTYTAMPPLPPRPGVSTANAYPDPLAQPKPPRVPGPPMDKPRVRMERTPGPETTPPGITAPETAPATTAPETAPATTAPETAPATTVPDTAPATTVPGTAPATTTPDKAPAAPASDFPPPAPIPPAPEPNK
ncbi:MAG TPA: hypothetical protein VG269_01605 [Tepidisphaeraceae bacterium]|jgi:hypothetical protein|nr:hypothetical protein [Tepidisphaeraceae bacterium]